MTQSLAGVGVERSLRYCIVGAGASGLVAAKNLQELGVPFDMFDAHTDVGGIWDIQNPSSTIYESTHTITSKKVTPYTDFPLPDSAPIYMHHTVVINYLRSYARKFDLYRHLELGKRVARMERLAGGGWEVQIEGEELPRKYRGVIIANGHNWCPKVPSYPGTFSGRSFHSKDYKNPHGLEGKRVVVVGSGNTGCDIAVEVSRVASVSFLSARRGYYYLPKFLLGIPVDELGQSSQSVSLPIWLIRIFYRLLVWLAMGDQTKYGLPKPDHKLLQTPPISNSLMPYFVAHGAVRMKPDIQRLEGGRVHFKDGTSEEVDCVIYATGFQPSFPFIDSQHLAWRDGRPHPYLFIFHPEYEDLFFAGLTDGTGGHFPTADYGTQLIARYIWSLDHDPSAAREFAAQKRQPPPDLSQGIAFIDTPRNYTQFELHYYTKLIRSLIKKFSSSAERAGRRRKVAVESLSVAPAAPETAKEVATWR
ncbi:MAG: hypothetical protein RJA70_1032 [Pseudomonadota bacterium]|jgi:hypothetical protein